MAIVVETTHFYSCPPDYKREGGKFLQAPGWGTNVKCSAAWLQYGYNQGDQHPVWKKFMKTMRLQKIYENLWIGAKKSMQNIKIYEFSKN